MHTKNQEESIHCLDEDEIGMFLAKEEKDESSNDMCSDKTEEKKIIIPERISTCHF